MNESTIVPNPIYVFRVPNDRDKYAINIREENSVQGNQKKKKLFRRSKFKI